MQFTQCIAGWVAIMGLGRLHPQLQWGGPESQQPPGWHLQKISKKNPKIKLLQKDILSNKQNWHLQEMSPKRKKKKKVEHLFHAFQLHRFSSLKHWHCQNNTYSRSATVCTSLQFYNLSQPLSWPHHCGFTSREKLLVLFFWFLSHSAGWQWEWRLSG